jgi:alpha-glucosidase
MFETMKGISSLLFPDRRCSFRPAGRVSLALLVFAVLSQAQTWTVSSPNAGLTIEAKQGIISGISTNNICCFRVLLGTTAVIDWSPVGVTASGQDFVNNLTFVSQTKTTVNETYTLPSGKRSTYSNNCNELTLTFSNSNSRQVAFHIRAYNEAAAICSELLGTGSLTVSGEATGFTIASGTGWGFSPGGNEKPYTQFTVGSAAGSWADPVLFKTAGGWALLADVAVYGDYTGSNFSSKTASKNIYQITFTGGQGAITGTLPWKLPWRVAIVGTTLGPIVESSVVENLNPPCELTDISWIKSGRCSWSYPTQDNDHSVTLQKHYVDFASQVGWEYNTTDWNFDKTQVAGLCQYATPKNVDEELWYNYSEVNTQAKEDAIFSQCHTWGIKSLKIDFIFDNGDENTSCNQNLMKWYDMTAKNLASNKLMVTLHGNTVPRGQRRRWPNCMTWEGVEGYEYVGRGYAGPKHNCSVPFIRQIIGPMDITPVLFDLDQLSNGPGSQRTSTDAHELALSVIMESGLQHFADRPESYNACVGLPFLKVVPASWDDIRFIDGAPGESVIMARRKGNDWYVAGISALAAKTFSVPLSFLKTGSYSVDLYKDSTGGTKYTMAKQTITINPSTPLSVWVKDNGGFCCRISNSYAVVSKLPHYGDAAPAGKKLGGMDRLSLYHLVRGAAGGSPLKTDRIVDISGKTITVNDAKRLPQGVFVPVRSR